MNDKKIIGLIPAAILIEALITYGKQFIVDGVFCWQMLASIMISILITCAYKINIVKCFGLETKFNFIDYTITGILLSRGSNYVFDLLHKFSQ